MSESYFAKFPNFLYSNTICVDITRRSVIANKVQQDLFAYFPYEMKSHQRPDTIADRYYGDSSFSWLVYLSNKITDPYYDLPMDDRTFENFIVIKYGSFPNAQNLILNWQVNWAGSTDEQIDTGFYNTNIPEPQKKYYEAVYGPDTKIIYYRRRRVDWQTTTNVVVRFNIANTSGSFQTNEVVRLISGPDTLSNSYVTFSNTTQVMTQHVFGNVTSNATNQYLLGTTSGTTANVTQIINVTNNISQAEMVYWAPVYAFDYEVGLNEQRKFIRLIDSKYSISIAEKLRKDLQT